MFDLGHQIVIDLAGLDGGQGGRQFLLRSLNLGVARGKLLLVDEFAEELLVVVGQAQCVLRLPQVAAHGLERAGGLFIPFLGCLKVKRRLFLLVFQGRQVLPGGPECLNQRPTAFVPLGYLLMPSPRCLVPVLLTSHFAPELLQRYPLLVQLLLDFGNLVPGDPETALVFDQTGNFLGILFDIEKLLLKLLHMALSVCDLLFEALPMLGLPAGSRPVSEPFVLDPLP
ncbi:MAG: hypothetical protein OXE83_05390 [Gammaproteobacteria bacterium]|nr:hypothetical protein [Gammaproteobacteria bacterium]